jgi:branched-chain amino acid transport system permease protein
MKTVIQYTIDAISSGGLYALLALGLSMTFGISRIVNLAQSELIMVPAYLIMVTAPWAAPLVILAALVSGIVLALLMERFAFRPLRGADETTLLVASFAVSLGIQSVVEAAAGDKAKGTNFGGGLNNGIHFLGLTVAKLDLVEIGITLLLLLSLLYFLKRTTLGIQLRAAAIDFDMAELLGVRSQRVIMLAFAISGVAASVTAIVVVAQTGSLTPTLGVQPLLVGVVAVVVGGLESLGGAVVGGFLLGIVSVVLSVTLPQGPLQYQDALLYLIVIIVLLVRPQGLFARGSALERV